MRWFPALLSMIPSRTGSLQRGLAHWGTIEENVLPLRWLRQKCISAPFESAMYGTRTKMKFPSTLCFSAATKNLKGNLHFRLPSWGTEEKTKRLMRETDRPYLDYRSFIKDC